MQVFYYDILRYRLDIEKVDIMKVLAGMFLIGCIGIGVWLIVELVVDKLFDNSDLGDSDYGC